MPSNSRSGRLCASSSAPIDRREVCPVHASAAQAAPHLASRVPSTNGPTTSVGEGSFVAYNGNVFIIAGGAPLYVGTWSIYGGEKSVTQLSDGEFANLRPFPSDGTFISTQTGAVYRFAGGAPLYVPTWDDVGGSQPTILVNQDDLTRAGEAAPFDHIRRYPADGTFVNTSTGAVYRFAGGAPLYVPSWDDVGGSQPSTRVSQAPLDAGGDPSYPWGHVAKYPQDGTFVNTPTGTVYRFAGGAPLAVSSWEAVGGSHASTQVSAEVLERGGATAYPWGHTRFFPADGTVLSPLYVAWSFKVTGGVARKVTRQPASPLTSPRSTTPDDPSRGTT